MKAIIFAASLMFSIGATAEEATYIRNYSLESYRLIHGKELVEGRPSSQKKFRETLKASLALNKKLPHLKNCKCEDNITQMNNAQQNGFKVVKGSCPDFKGFVPLTLRFKDGSEKNLYPQYDGSEEDFIPVEMTREEERGQTIVRLRGYYNLEKKYAYSKGPRNVEETKSEIVLIESTPRDDSDLGYKLRCQEGVHLRACQGESAGRNVELRSLEFANSVLYRRGISCSWRPKDVSNPASPADARPVGAR